MPKDEIRRHGGFRRTKRHGTPLSCIKRGVAGAGGSPPQLSRGQSKSKSRGGFCSNQSRSCSGVSCRKSGVSSSTSSGSEARRSSFSSRSSSSSTAGKPCGSVSSRAARSRSGSLGTVGGRHLRGRLGQPGLVLLRHRSARLFAVEQRRLLAGGRVAVLGGSRGGGLVGRDFGILALLRHLAPGGTERLLLLALDLFLGHSVLALQLEMLPDGIVEYAHRPEPYRGREDGSGMSVRARATRFLPPRFAR